MVFCVKSLFYINDIIKKLSTLFQISVSQKIFLLLKAEENESLFLNTTSLTVYYFEKF